MMFIIANDGYIFGGYNPTSWLSQYCYADCDDAFLFSIKDARGQRKPFKCAIRK